MSEKNCKLEQSENVKRFSWKTEKLQHSDDEVLLVVDNENKEWKGHILNIVDLLNDLNDENEKLRTLLKERQYKKDIAKCREENERLRQLYEVLNKSDFKNKRLREENEQLRQTMQEVYELLAEAIDLFSDDTHYMIPVTKKAIKLLKGGGE